jgi:adenylate cyclase
VCRAIEIARAQHAWGWQLRAAIDLSHLRRRRMPGTEADAELLAVYGWFTEGFETADLRAAGELLQLPLV